MPTIDLEQRGTGGETRAIAVSRLRLQWHAAFTGGALPAASSYRQRLAWRRSCVQQVGACLEAVAGHWRASALYHGLESTDKGVASYRLGTSQAGFFAHRELGIKVLQHRQAIFGSSSGPRGDLVGLSTATGLWHGVEAKGYAPHLTTGGYTGITAAEYNSAKDQAKSLGDDLSTNGFPTATDHWTATTRSARAASNRLVVEDPTADGKPGGGTEPPETDGAFDGGDIQERLLQAYYQVVADIEALGEATTFYDAPNEADRAWPVRGILLPGSRYWVGAAEELFEARRERRLRALLPRLRVTQTDDENARDGLEMKRIVIGDNGLVLARISS